MDLLSIIEQNKMYLLKTWCSSLHVHSSKIASSSISQVKELLPANTDAAPDMLQPIQRVSLLFAAAGRAKITDWQEAIATHKGHIQDCISRQGHHT